MGISAIPETLEEFRAYRDRFEAERMVYADSNREVSAATIDLVLAMYLPRFLFALGRPVAMALCSDRLVDAIGRKRPPRWLRAMVNGAMQFRRLVLGLLPEPRRLKRITQRRNPTYPDGYQIAALGVPRSGSGRATGPAAH